MKYDYSIEKTYCFTWVLFDNIKIFKQILFFQNISESNHI